MMRAILPLLTVLFVVTSLPAQQGLSYDDYVKKLDQQIRLGDTRNIPRTIKDNSSHTVGHFQGMVVADLRRGNQDNAEMRQLLKDNWEKAFGGRTLEELERWLERFSSDKRTWDAYTRAKNALNQTYGELGRLRAGKVADRAPWEQLRDTLQQVCRAMGTVGHQIDAADAWGVLAQVYSSMPNKTLDDRRASVDATREFLSHREAWGYTGDSFYAGNKAFAKGEEEAIKAAQGEEDKRQEEGYGAAVKGVDAYLMPKADTLEKASDLEFKALKKPKVDFSLRGNSLPPEWFGVSISGTGPEKLGWFSRVDLYLVRPEPNEFGVSRESEADLSKNPYEEVEVSDRLKTPSVFHLGPDESIPYAMWFWTGTNSVPFQGMDHNLAPTRDRAAVYYRSASSWTADFDGTKVTFYDDNANGKLFENDPFATGLKDRNVGPTVAEEIEVPTFDSMQIGRGKLQPLSSWVKVEDAWYHLRGLDGGLRVGIRPANPEYFKTGQVQLDFEGSRSLKPQFLIIVGEGDFAAAAFDIAGGKPVEVPVGNYRLAYGRIESGKGARMLTANIVAGQMEPFEVKEGETATVELGGPFHIEFEKEAAAGQISIEGTSLRVRGRGGEFYTHLSGAPVEAEVMTAKDASGKGARSVGEFVMIPNADVLNKLASKFRELSSQVGYYTVPEDQREITFTLSFVGGADTPVGLQQKKNKLFGKLLPLWK